MSARAIVNTFIRRFVALSSAVDFRLVVRELGKMSSPTSPLLLFLFLSARCFAYVYICFGGLQFTNQIAVGGDDVDIPCISVEPRDLVGRVGGRQKEAVGYRRGTPG